MLPRSEPPALRRWRKQQEQPHKYCACIASRSQRYGSLTRGQAALVRRKLAKYVRQLELMGLVNRMDDSQNTISPREGPLVFDPSPQSSTLSTQPQVKEGQ